MQPFIIDTAFLSRFDSSDDKHLEKLATIHRINCLAGLKAAGHGWLGACFSSIELLACIYHRHILDPGLPITARASVHLSKGHAAMAQYAIIAGMGCMPTEQLLTYKRCEGLPAHCDRQVAGVDSDSGSLGQGLSKAIGVSLAHKSNQTDYPVFAIMGDGELQEGQLFEAFLSLKSLNPGRCVPIIDRNRLQSDSQTAHIKDADDWSMVFKGIGLKALEIDGHSIPEVCAALAKAISSTTPTVIIANTIKGYGTNLTAMPPDTERRKGVWHGRIPDDQQYQQILGELVNRVNDPDLDEQFCIYQAGNCNNGSEKQLPTKKARPAKTYMSTGQAFTDTLLIEARNNEDIFVLDADLEKSCRLESIAESIDNRFLEIGISEQDMCSIAAGLALSGKIAVTNTYASFYKRSIDQIFSCVTEKLPVIFAGHYAGADYFSDGKSHQSVNDTGFMRSMMHMEIYEPVDEKTTRLLLQKCISRMRKDLKESRRGMPAYFRLHRTPICESFAPTVEGDSYLFFAGPNNGGQKHTLFTSGPHMLRVALAASKKLARDKISLGVMAVTFFSDTDKHFKELIDKSEKVFTLEDHVRESGLGAFIGSCSLKNPVKIGIRNYLQSCLYLEEMLKRHQIDTDTVCTVIKKVLSCSHNQKISARS